MPSRFGHSGSIRNTAVLRYVVLVLLVFLGLGLVKYSPIYPPPVVSGSRQYPKDAYKAASTPPAPQNPTRPGATADPTATRTTPNRQHPIDELIGKADDEFYALVSRASPDLFSAATRYRELRGRHPPPGFDQWYEFAKSRDALVVEEFFDQIYHDLNPFWGIDAPKIRNEARNFDQTIKIRAHNATTEAEPPWMHLWLDLIKTIEQYLPDMDLAINVMDEPRLVVPWEQIDAYVQAEKRSRKLVPASEVISEYSKNPETGPSADPAIEWNTSGPYFDIARRGCHPDSPARLAQTMTDFSRDPHISLRYAAPHMYKGYVSNWTRATSICDQPDLQSLHGAFIEPLSIKSSDHLMPMFGGSKLATNNEILLPPAMYWSDNEMYSGAGFEGHTWEEKHDKAIWRGAATGGRNKIDTWRGFHRHRLVSMMNGTQVARAENWTEIPGNFALPPQSYNLKSLQTGKLGEWTGQFCDAAFMDLLCWEAEPDMGCRYTGEYYQLVKAMPMAEQFRYKYLPDLDGNSFSGRYRGFLRSNSLPIKATIFKEWHDSRLVPWKHFVPMDNRYLDFHGILEYFLGYPGFSGDGPESVVPGHDHEARKIAQAGEDWAKKALRREDMQIYVFRLLLEYARVSDDNRERLGFVGDLQR
ncbi:MAG: hypothetical protein M1823_002283 [Watsoniomyces obsoletus]|nr:MAG: hypothetical protein M1823_002283 [Watsoniomyces obsoletus]